MPIKIKEEILLKNLRNRGNILEEGIIVINSDFNDELLEDVYFDFLKISKNKNIDTIQIYINSHGGYTSTFFPLYSLIQASEKPVETICMGKAYSAGAMLLLSGTMGCRKAHKYSSILIHEVASDYGYNSITQNKLNTKWLENINNNLTAIIKQRTKLTDSRIKEYMSSNVDIFITPQEALKFGIIDKII